MSELYHFLHHDDEYKAYSYMLALECSYMTGDTSLLDVKSPVSEENVRTYFNGVFLHDFLMFYERKRDEDPHLPHQYQVFLGVCAMEQGVKIEQGDMKMMQHALSKSDLQENKKKLIGKAFVEYAKTGSLSPVEVEDQSVVSQRKK